MIYKAGCDPSGGGADEFAWAIAHQDQDRVVVDLVGARGRRGRLPLNPETAVSDCAVDLKRYEVWEVIGDKYGAQWVVESFRKHGIAYRHSERTKSELFLDLLPLITAGRVELPPDAELVRQAKLLQRRRGAQGKDVVDAPAGAHDDRINACALAIMQATGNIIELTEEHFLQGVPLEQAANRWLIDRGYGSNRDPWWS
jgi:hypothetical protein